MTPAQQQIIVSNTSRRGTLMRETTTVSNEEDP
jgi:hypothetical protein